MIPGLLPSYCATPLVHSVGCIPCGAAASQNPVVGLHRPHGWLQRRRPLSAEKGATSAAVSSPGTVFPPGTSEVTLARVSRRRRRQRYLQTRLHGTDGASSAFSSPPSSTPLPSTTSLTTTRPPTPSTSPNPGAFSGAGGAEWAGWECRFSGTNGKPVPVPEDYVPESLREWDVEVWGFETLTSEQLRPAGEGKKGKGRSKGDNGGSSALYRKRGRVYPETGCALDNLTLEVNAQTSPLEDDDTFVASFPAGGHVLGKKAEGSKSLQLEVGVVVPGVQFMDPSMTLTEGEAAEAEKEMSRLRVELRVDSTSGSSSGGGDKGEKAAVLGPTVTVTRERRYRGTFDDGLLYKGGGLDSQKLRRLLRSKCFAESEAAPTSDALTGPWAARDGRWQLLDGPTPEDKPSDVHTGSATASGVGHAFDVEEVQTLLLPGGITVRSGPWHPDDGISETSADTTDTTAASASTETDGMVAGGEAGWAVEVGWFLGVAGAAGERRNERVALTTVFDARTMTPLAAWKREEKRE